MNRLTVVLLLLLTMLTSSCATASAAPTAVPNTFVKVQSGKFVLNGAPFQFTGWNIYNANTRNNCANPPVNLGGNQSALQAQLSLMGSKTEVIRVWFFENLATTNGKRDWAAFDTTLAAARATGKKVIATLGNQWADCEGPNAFYKPKVWYDSGYVQTPNPGGLGTYKQWVKEIATRYKNDPTIMMWQLMNEAEAVTSYGGNCLSTSPSSLKHFADDAGGAIKSVDPNHLISLGAVGAGQCGTDGANYGKVHASTAVDVCTFHGWYGYASLPSDIAQCKKLGKPTFVEEDGYIPNDVGGFQGRANMFNTKMNEAFGDGAQGYLAWDWMATGSRADYHDVGPEDPAVAVLNR